MTLFTSRDVIPFGWGSRIPKIPRTTEAALVEEQNDHRIGIGGILCRDVQYEVFTEGGAHWDSGSTEHTASSWLPNLNHSVLEEDPIRDGPSGMYCETPHAHLLFKALRSRL
jgi:hypothetical protein